MRKIAAGPFIIALLSLAPLVAPGAQEYQDFLSDWFELFPALDSLENTGLTTLPSAEISAGGERSSLGNAYTAVSDDISFFEANPAASALLERTELAFFHRNLIADVVMDSVFYTQRENNLGYGFGAKFIHFEFTSVDGRGNQRASATPTEILAAGNISYNFFDNYYSSGLAMGANLKVVNRNIPSRLYEAVLNPEIANQNLWGFMADVGLLTRFNFLKAYNARDKNFSLGLVGKNLGPPVKGDGLPSEVRLGLAYRPLHFFLLAVDTGYLFNFADLSLSEGLSLAAGLEFRFVDFFALQSGFEWRGGPRFSMGGDVNLQPVSIQFQYNLDLTSLSNRLDNFSVSAALNFGDEGRAEIQAQVDDLYIQALVALSNGEFQQVIELCNDVLALDPSFSPARRTLEVARITLEREQQFIEFEQSRQDQVPQEAGQE